MKKYLKGFLILASIITLVYLLMRSEGVQAIESLKLEVKRYEGLNLWYFAIAGFFIVGSYFSGWISGKIRQL